MKTKLQSSSEATAGEVPPLRVLVMYGDFAGGLGAKRFLDRISRQLDSAAGLSANFWRFDLLGEVSLCEQAAVEAAAVDVILLVVGGQRQLPATVKDWMNRWLDHQGGHPCAFGVLLDRECAGSPEENPAVASVREFAAAAATDFFCGLSEAAIPGGASRFQESPACARAASSLAEEILNSELTRRNWRQWEPGL